MKKIAIFLIFLTMCSATIAANDDKWFQYEPNSFINLDAKNIAINPAMKQISFYSKKTNIDKKINNQPVDTLVTLSLVDCSGIVKTKDISRMYYYKNDIVYRINLDKATLWDFHSPDSLYYKSLQGFCADNFKARNVVKK